MYRKLKVTVILFARALWDTLGRASWADPGQIALLSINTVEGEVLGYSPGVDYQEIAG